MTAERNVVGTYRKKGTFRAQHAEKTGRAAQTTPLPPRCRDCRLPGKFSLIDGEVTMFFCDEHIQLYAFIEGDDGLFYLDWVKTARNAVAAEIDAENGEVK